MKLRHEAKSVLGTVTVQLSLNLKKKKKKAVIFHLTSAMLNVWQHLNVSLDSDCLRGRIYNDLLGLDAHIQAGKILIYFVILRHKFCKSTFAQEEVFLSRTRFKSFDYNSLFLLFLMKDHSWRHSVNSKCLGWFFFFLMMTSQPFTPRALSISKNWTGNKKNAWQALPPSSFSRLMSTGRDSQTVLSLMKQWEKDRVCLRLFLWLP